MRTSNPALNERAFAPVGGLAPSGIAARDTMTIDGTVSKTALLLVLTVVAAALTYTRTLDGGLLDVAPGLLIGGSLLGLVVAIATIVKPTWARWTAPLYAVVEGAVVGAISAIYEFDFNGIVAQAAGLTFAVLAVMLAAYRTRLIQVTQSFRTGVVAATGAIALVYLVSLGLRLFGVGVPFLHDNGPVGIVISVVIVAVAALNLVLDFDFIEQGAKRGAPAHLEWYGAFGLLVTLIWLYLEILRLLSKLRSR
jgi:uncharacterized YccA/Bax inhibitor family protein